ncbi:conserved hypothetical protein [Vibrio crassostreae]|uniref:hypothetical protein n=1 Tax=Vibrio crassostreae TaxID=246167 RepID=UPI001B30471B|nr:hypothetical protein [Vibrio crassostreae]CAK2879536.1 conserved hypothetical protein [Vibrio crassostreae]CAK3384083.1 conserved hypothetical protein [Vibrio crassostreae]
MNSQNVSFFNQDMELDELSILHHLMYQEAGECSRESLESSVKIFIKRSFSNVLSNLDFLGYIEVNQGKVYLTDFGLEYYEQVPHFR